MLETDLVMSVVNTFHRSIAVDKLSPSDVDVASYLTALSKTNRFDLAVMFMAKADKTLVKELIDALGGDLSTLRKMFGV